MERFSSPAPSLPTSFANTWPKVTADAWPRVEHSFGHPERDGFIGRSPSRRHDPVMPELPLPAMQKKNLVTLAFIGDGGSSTGAFYEGMISLRLQKLPMSCLEDNAYGLFHSHCQTERARTLATRRTRSDVEPYRRRQ